jgi:hypothetical protein
MGESWYFQELQGSVLPKNSSKEELETLLAMSPKKTKTLIFSKEHPIRVQSSTARFLWATALNYSIH